ncbi:MAG: DHH family phosphoesterase [Clostridia bacterium]|nr:DHH family phosphoesterase [Clostridia bacterium]
MDTNKKSEKLYSTGAYYVFIILILGFVSLYFNKWLGTAEIVFALVLFIIELTSKHFAKKRITAMFEQMTLNAGATQGNSLAGFSLPTIIVHAEGKIKWYNNEFQDIFPHEQLFDRRIVELIPEFPIESMRDKDMGLLADISIGTRHFKVAGSLSSHHDDKQQDVCILYFTEITDFVNIKNKYINEKTFECLLFVDNYDELTESTPNTSVPQLQALLYKYINDWARENGGVLIKYEKDKYYITFEYRYLEQFIKNKFDILNKIRSIDEGNTLPATVSIGIGLNGSDIQENSEFAKAAINMALGRGGDQVVIKDNEQFRFYGGSTKEHEKSTRVKARVVSFALCGLIQNAENVVVMSHKNTDIDALGASFGIYRICKMHNKPVNILLESYDQTVRTMLTRFENVDEYSGLFINNQQAGAHVKSETLLVVVDTHKPSLVENEALLSRTDQIVVIDHHRRGAEFIEHTALIYHEPYASSACEMITEILQYTSNKMSVTKLEAECLYSGILVDTKHFTFKTGVRTFEAASFLRKQGVDTVAIKTLFQQDLTSYIKRSSIIKNAEIVRENIAISTCFEEDRDIHVLVAQAADELLNIKGITASFVLYTTADGVNISGRSLGGINVQVILEKLGGGGHLTIAGAQLDDVSVDDAKQRLLVAIDDYYIETTN